MPVYEESICAVPRSTHSDELSPMVQSTHMSVRSMACTEVQSTMAAARSPNFSQENSGVRPRVSFKLDAEPSQPRCKAEPGLLSWLTGTFVNSAIATAMRPPPDVQGVCVRLLVYVSECVCVCACVCVCLCILSVYFVCVFVCGCVCVCCCVRVHVMYTLTDLYTKHMQSAS
jgi:hypothetical protein